MNKFIAYPILFAVVVAVASANPLDVNGDELASSALNPTNDEETSNLDDSTKVFSDFCISTRDHVIGDIRSRSNGMASGIFNVLFNSAENIGLKAVEVSRDATQKLSNQIRDPNAPIAEPTNEVESIIAEGQKNIAEQQTQPRTLLTGVFSVLSATKNAVTSTVMAKFEDVKSKLGLSLLTGSIKEACDQIAQYEADINEQFATTKASLKEEGANVDAVTIDKVPCVTARRVIRLDGICKFAYAAQNPLIKAITYKPLPTTNSQ